MSSYLGYGNGNGNGQTKPPRTKAVKPILKKITHSEKNSLDLDRLATEQDDYGGGAGGGMGGALLEYGMPSRSSHDVVFSAATRRGYHHRSTSGTSQFSTNTTGSGHRGVAFVHPFQQTPRPFTPPLALSSSYQNSLRESEYSERESPALETSTEDEDPVRRPNLPRNPSSTNQTSSSLTRTTPSPLPQEPLRLQTKLSTSTSRLALATSSSSLQAHNAADLNPEVGSPSETMSPSSLRTSLEGFRLRSRSEVNESRYRAETIQEARRKFYEKEQAKEEKAAREEIRLREKRNQKEARQLERGHRRSSATSDATRSKRSKSDLTKKEKGEGSFITGNDQNGVLGQNYPFSLETPDTPPRYTKLESTKKKTHSAWTKLMMWIRTRFIRMGRKRAQ